MVEIGLIMVGQVPVSHVEIRIVLHPILPILLLRRTSEMCIYYADDHNVDEDLRTIASQSGYWDGKSVAGIAQRHMNNTLSDTYIYVASSSTENSQIIRMRTVSTKTRRLSRFTGVNVVDPGPIRIMVSSCAL